MIGGPAAQWLLTAVFAAAGLVSVTGRWVGPPRRERAGSARLADRVSAAFCSTMCAALIAMTWRSEPAVAQWLQAAWFGSVAVWLGLVSMAGSGRVRRPSLPALLHTLMAGVMIWMLTAMPAGSGVLPTGSAAAGIVSMSRAATPVPVVAVSILLAVSCAAAAIPWLAWAIGPGPRVKDPVAASRAAMTAGMAAMLHATL